MFYESIVHAYLSFNTYFQNKQARRVSGKRLILVDYQNIVSALTITKTTYKFLNLGLFKNKPNLT